MPLNAHNAKGLRTFSASTAPMRQAILKPHEELKQGIVGWLKNWQEGITLDEGKNT